MSGMEARIDRQRERHETTSPVMETAYRKAMDVFKDPAYAIREQDFTHTMDGGPHIVRQDLEYVRRIKSSFHDSREEANMKKTADIFEAAYITQTRENGWLGDAHVLKTSELDDIKHGVDMVAEFRRPRGGSNLLALGVDLTSSKEAISKKLKAIRDSLQQGKLSEIRYLKDRQGDALPARKDVPRTIVGVSEGAVKQIAGLWVNGKHKALAEHGVQKIAIEQMYTQLELQLKYARNWMRHEAAASIEEALDTLRPLRVAKRHIADAELRSDPTVEEIAYQAKLIFRL